MYEGETDFLSYNKLAINIPHQSKWKKPRAQTRGPAGSLLLEEPQTCSIVIQIVYHGSSATIAQSVVVANTPKCHNYYGTKQR